MKAILGTFSFLALWGLNTGKSDPAEARERPQESTSLSRARGLGIRHNPNLVTHMGVQDQGLTELGNHVQPLLSLSWDAFGYRQPRKIKMNRDLSYLSWQEV